MTHRRPQRPAVTPYPAADSPTPIWDALADRWAQLVTSGAVGPQTAAQGASGGTSGGGDDGTA